MINTKNKPVLFIHIDAGDKQALKREAENHGMALTTYCRMILLKSLKEVAK